MTTRIRIPSDFSRFPAGRFYEDGPFSGQRFREELLVPALMKGHVEVEFDGALGYGSSFLEEAFGGLLRHHQWTINELRSTLNLRTRDSSLVGEVWGYMERESKG